MRNAVRASEPTRSRHALKKNLIELKVIFLETVHLELYSEIFSFCTPTGDIYGRPLLSPECWKSLF